MAAARLADGCVRLLRRRPPEIVLWGASVSQDVKCFSVGEGDLFVYDLARETMTRLTFDGVRMGSIWSADGKELIHGSSLGGREGVYSLPASGGGTERLLLKDGGEYAVFPEAMVPSTGRMVVGQSGGLGGWSLTTFAPGEDAPRPLLVNPSIEGGAALSPDGKWLAYTSDSSGQYEVYVRPFPEAGGKWQISRDAARARPGHETVERSSIPTATG